MEDSAVAYLSLIFWAQMRIREPRRHVEHEGVVELAKLVGHVDVLAASLDDNLANHKEGWRGGVQQLESRET